MEIGLCDVDAGNDVLDQAAEVGRIIRGLMRKLDSTGTGPVA
jgi:hypothetical protein